MLEFLLRCETAYITYKLLKKDDPENVKEQKIKINKLIKDLSKIASDDSQSDDVDFFDCQVVKIVDNTYQELHEKFEKDQESDRIWREEEAEKKRLQDIEDAKAQEIKLEERRQKRYKDLEAERERTRAIENAPELTEEQKAERKKVAQEELYKAFLESEKEKAEIAALANKKCSDVVLPIKEGEEDKKEEDKKETAEEKEEAVPEPKIEEMQVVPTVEEDLPQPTFEVDELLGYKNWAMQSSTWKYFNVLFERLNAKQLQYKCKNGKTVFENMCNVMKLGLTNTRTAISDR